MRDWKPAEHIFVKDAQQFVAMLKRRGYEPVVSTDERGMSCTVRSDSVWYMFSVESVLFQSIAEVAETLDAVLAYGWKHMQCAQCGTPVLVRIKYIDEGATTLKWYCICSVQAGPHTTHLETCEKCGADFSLYPPPLREINDID